MFVNISNLTAEEVNLVKRCLLYFCSFFFYSRALEVCMRVC